jgi:hypothetical protein
VVLYASVVFGMNVALFVLEEYVTAPATDPPPPLSVKVEALMVDAFSASLNVAITVDPTATPVVLLAGVTAVTDGGVGGGVCVPVLELEPPPPHPATRTATLTRHQAIRKRIIEILPGYIRPRVCPIHFTIRQGRKSGLPVFESRTISRALGCRNVRAADAYSNAWIGSDFPQQTDAKSI